MTIAVISRQIEPKEYTARRKRPYIILSSVTLVYIASTISYFCINDPFKGYNIYLVISLTAYIIQGLMYTYTVCYGLLPALKQLSEMSDESKSVLFQFYVFMVAIVIKVFALSGALAIFDDNIDKDQALWLTGCFFFYGITTMGPAFYMLWSHHKTFRQSIRESMSMSMAMSITEGVEEDLVENQRQTLIRGARTSCTIKMATLTQRSDSDSSNIPFGARITPTNNHSASNSNSLGNPPAQTNS